jgi:hypothetical protein
VTKIVADESPDELLSRARWIARFNNLAWPAELSPDQIAALMAKGWNKEHLQDYKDKRRLVSEAINNGSLLVRTEKHNKPENVLRKVHYNEFGIPAPRYEVLPATTTTRQYIGASDCADWLKSRGIKANEYITEWLRIFRINLSQWQTKQEKDEKQAESSKSVTRYQKASELCKAAIRKVWERDPSVTITGNKNAMADQPELSPFLDGDEKNGIPKRKESWIVVNARDVAKEMGITSQGGRPPNKPTRSR